MKGEIPMKSLEERMDLRRRQILAGVILGFGAAQTAMILDRLLTPVPWIHGTLIVISLSGWILFGVELFLMFRTGGPLHKNPHVELALNDEFVRQKRQKAAMAGFWAVMIALAAILLLDAFVPFDAGIAAQAAITAGVAGFIGTFLYYDREDGDA
jgi:predicted tellurium resistance membrane protein TerC